MKIYGHFSISAKRREELKDFHSFVDIEYREILRHVSTRWLSLLPCIDRLILNWPALKSYFLSKGENLPKILQKAILFKDDVISENIEIYLLFCSNIFGIFNETILQLESNTASYIDIYNILASFHSKIKKSNSK